MNSGTNCPTNAERGRGRPQEFAAETETVGGSTGATNETGLRKDGRRKGPQHDKEFAAETAAVTGISSMACTLGK